MTKKEYILKILKILKDDWDVANALAIITVKVWDDSKTLNIIFGLLKNSLKTYKWKKYKGKINKTMLKLKQELAEEKITLDKELLDLEKQLEEL